MKYKVKDYPDKDGFYGNFGSRPAHNQKHKNNALKGILFMLGSRDWASAICFANGFSRSVVSKNLKQV